MRVTPLPKNAFFSLFQEITAAVEIFQSNRDTKKVKKISSKEYQNNEKC